MSLTFETRQQLRAARSAARHESLYAASHTECGRCGGALPNDRKNGRFCTDVCSDVFHGNHTPAASA